jgi:hypothetical protein
MMPNAEDGMTIVGPKIRIVYPRASVPAKIDQLVSSTNVALNAVLTIHGTNTDFEPALPARPGFPSEEHSEQFLNLIELFYCVPQLADDLQDDEAKAFLCFQALPHPLQAIFLRRLGRTWPLSTSLEEPEPDRPLRRVGVWSGGSGMEQFEIEALRHVFDRAAVNVELVSPDDDQSADAFRRFYEHPEFDVVWIMGHGEHDALVH